MATHPVPDTGWQTSRVGRAGRPAGLALEQRAQLGELRESQLLALAALDAGDHLADQRGELGRVERLRDVVEPAEVEAARAVTKLRAGGQEDDRDAARVHVVQQLLRDSPTVEPRHH